MNSDQPLRIDADSQYAGILERTVRAYTTAQAAAASVADCLAGRAEACFRAVQLAEEELDCLDREIDVSVTAAIIEVTPLQARELLSAMKMVLDLERIGDLFASVASCACGAGVRVAIEDVSDLVKMATLVERMLADAHGAFAVRNVDRAMAVLRTDSEVDRLRNLLILRRLERTESEGVQNGLQVVFMAQALERAGDHVKNLAEETCQLATGRTLRHMLHVVSKPEEQMYLEHLRARHHIGEHNPDGRSSSLP